MNRSTLDACHIDTSDFDMAMDIAVEESIVGDLLRVFVKLRFKGMDALGIIEAVTKAVGLRRTCIKSSDSHSFILKFGEHTATNLVIGINFSEFPLEQKNSFGNTSIAGDPELVLKTAQVLKANFFSEPDQQATWVYKGPNDRIDDHTVELSHRKDVFDEFYPWIKPNLDSYYNNFHEDDSNVLLLIGEPGTGKTTFIRDMIHRQSYSTTITHDGDLMVRDQLFINFLVGDDDLLVLEDADILLQKREIGNKVMAKLLNAADGLIRTRKKIILTANITHLDDVDSALIRPGRCFDVVRFRELTADEARAAAVAANVRDPGQPCTLANLFKGANIEVERKLGFGFHKRVP